MARRRQCPRASFAGLLLALLAVFFGSPLAGQGGDGRPPVVRKIEIYSDLAEEQIGEIEQLIAFAPGERLTEAAVRRTLTNLHATGLAWEAEVRAEPAQGGVVAQVIVRSNVVVDKVSLVGNLGLSEKALAGALRQRAGQPLVESRILQGVFRLQDRLAEAGYLEARVRVGVEFAEDDAKRATVVYTVESGPRATVRKIAFTGSYRPFTADKLAEEIEIGVSDVYRQRLVREDAERLRGWLIGEGYRQADVSRPRVEYDAEADQVDLTVEVEVGPRVVVEIIGAEIKQLRKKELLPFLDPEGYDEALLLAARERIVNEYQRRGHYDVEVETDQRLEEGELQVTITIRPGPVYELVVLELVGNEAFPEEVLRDLMATSPKSLLPFGRGRLVDSELAADVSNIETYYALRGYTDAEVASAQVNKEGEELSVRLEIREGKPRRVATLEFSGCEAISCEALESELEQRGFASAGGPFHPLIVDDSVDYIGARYQEIGFADVRVSATTEWNDARTRVAVEISVLEGPQTVLDRVIVRGHRKTHRDVIVRALDFEPGQPVSGTRILEGQRRLYGLGIFSDVDVRLAPADLGASTRDVVVRVTEGTTRRLSYGLGYDTEEGVRGLLGFSNGNVFGRGYTLRADFRLSEQDQRFRLAFDQPFFGRFDLPVTYTFFYSDDRETSFDVEKLGVRVEAVREVDRHRRLSLIYDYRIVEPTLRDRERLADQVSLERENQRVRISSLIPNILWDHRDDPLDATTGWTSFLRFEWAFPFLSTDEEFLKLFGQGTRYLSLGRAGTVAASVRAGGLLPLGGTLADGITDASSVSISERFFAGGSTSHRAYDRDALGIPGETLLDGSPIGGSHLLLVNVDYRFPIVGAVGGVVFFDAGNVWADASTVDPSDLKTGVGLGVRYASPIGPLRLEVGWKLDRLSGEDGVAYFLSIGNPF